MKKKSLSLSEAYHLLEPGPVVLLTSAYKEQPNIMAMSWYTLLETERPLVGCVVRSTNYSFNFLKTTKECAINIPALELAEKVVGCGITSGRDIDKYERLGMTTELASGICVPLLEECFANFECKIVDMKMVPQYNFFIMEIIHARKDISKDKHATIHHQGNGIFTVSGKTIEIPFNH